MRLIDQPSPVDGTPLLSTLVQSAAALVAIVAGLLTARLVALAGERQALTRRLRNLEEIRQQNDADLHSAKRAMLEYDGHDFIENAFDTYLTERDAIPYGEYYAMFAYKTSTAKDLKPFFDKFVAQVTSLEQVLDVDERSAGLKPATWEDERVELAQGQEDELSRRIANRLLDRVENAWRGRGIPAGSWGLTPTDLDRTPPEIHAASMGIEADLKRDMQRAIYEAETQTKATALELDHARNALDTIAHPKGLGPTLLALIIISACGIVAPLLHMTFGPLTFNTNLRMLYVGLFLLSLIVFFVYLGLEIRRLARRND